MHDKIKSSYAVVVTRLQWLTETVFEVGLSRPEGFRFIPGQKIRVANAETGREYTLINHPDSSELTICVRYVSGGRFSPLLAHGRVGDCYLISSATGFFIYQPTTRPVVFMATGTGIAPFLAFIRAGVRDFFLLQGARMEDDLLYRDEVSRAAQKYIPCLSAPKNHGLIQCLHVTEYLESHLPATTYDFYLCGNGNMVRDAVRIVDRLFSGSRVFVETFF